MPRAKRGVMIVIASPSKTQRLGLASGNHCFQPPFLEQARTLIGLLKLLDKSELAQLMNTSEKLTDLTHQRIRDFTAPHTAENAGTVLPTFQGDAFSAMTTASYSADDFQFAQTHLRILSGLYGVLRPLDLMQPYRLEMATRLISDRGHNLYAFWGTIITESLNKELESMKEQVVINCASKEYSRAIEQKLLTAPLLTITFKQQKNGMLKTIAIHAKRARGMFIDYLIKKRINEIDRLTEFSEGGYCFAPDLSSSSELVFVTGVD